MRIRLISGLKTYGPCLLLVGAIFAAYGNVYGNAFLYDDEFLILKNQLLRSWSNLAAVFGVSSTGGSGQSDAFYRPVQTLLYLVVFQCFGLSTAGFHFLNVTLHALNALCVVVLGRKLGFAKRPTFFAGLLWAVHPLHTEAVTYMSATADPAHTLFVLLGLICLTPAWTTRGRVGAAFFFIVALLSKEPAIVFPALAVVCLAHLSPPERRWRPQTYVVTWPYWLIAALYLLARKTILDFHHTFRFYTESNLYTENWLYRLYTFFATLPAYLRLMVWPDLLTMDRNFPVFTYLAWPVWLGVGLLILFIGRLLYERVDVRPVLTFAGAWFFAAHVPQSGVLLPVNSLFLEHWMYLPSIGLALGTAAYVYGLRSRTVRRGFAGGAVLAAIALGARTFAQNEYWRDPVTFYGHTLEHNPKNARGWNNVAMAFADRGEIQLAEAAYRRAIAISDVYPQTHHNLGLLLLARGEREGAILELRRALAMDPDFVFSRAKLTEIGASP